jgi:hypothetical protein
MFFSFERNKSSIPLSCGFALGFIHSPKNKIARFQHSSRQNLAISHHKNQDKSQLKRYFTQFLTEDFGVGAFLLAMRQMALLTQ